MTLSSWGCQDGNWNEGTCATATGATFSQPVTFTIYAADGTTVLARTTQTFNVPYRPSSDAANCTGGKWYDGSACFNGKAVNVTLGFSGVTVPDKVVWGLAFNTTYHGYSPVGESAACYAESGGCG